ncbi:polyA polymerase [Fusobacterium sp. CAG:439]|nr:polyA polymerase [Fusobacterium sp. CAG:439]
MNSKIIEKIKSDEILSKITDKFENEIYLVGGTVRDYYMGLDSTDRDIIVMDEEAREFALKLAELFEASFVPLDEENKIYRIVLADKINCIDVTNPVGDSIEKDLMRRDLTINAIAVNIRTGEIIDISGGVTDIRNKCINYVNELNFVDDPLRLLRVYRFQALYGFSLAPETINAVCKYSDLIHKPAVERINYEILKLFSGEYAHIALENMNKTWILEEIFPFVKELKQVPPNSHHHLDLFHHSIETVKQVQNLYSEASDEVKEHLNRVDFGGFSRLAHLKLAAFMHDIGKFSTWTIEEGKHRFIKHDDVGAKMSVKILKDLHCSNKQIDYISSMIKYHIYPSHVMTSPQITEKIMMRYVRKMDKNSIDAIILAQADRLSARGPEITDEIVERNITSLNMLLRFYLEARETLKPLPKLLSGNDVMDILNIKPSRKLGEIMEALHEAQVSGDVITREHAVEFVKKLV